MPSKAKQALYARNRIKRKFIEGRIEELTNKIAEGLARAEGGGAKNEKQVIRWAEQRMSLQRQLTRLPVRKKARKSKRTRRVGGTRVTQSGQGVLDW